jgi:molybdate transport system regulatory protein
MDSVKKKYSIGVRVWISEAEGHFIGRGRVKLLENIKKTGSITGGAKEMKMSYRQAWQMVEDMNKRAVAPLVEKILGGKGGGGAKITKEGEKIIEQYYQIEKAIEDCAQELTKTL